jgi:hypothetical protein
MSAKPPPDEPKKKDVDTLRPPAGEDDAYGAYTRALVVPKEMLESLREDYANQVGASGAPPRDAGKEAAKPNEPSGGESTVVAGATSTSKLSNSAPPLKVGALRVNMADRDDDDAATVMKSFKDAINGDDKLKKAIQDARHASMPDIQVPPPPAPERGPALNLPQPSVLVPAVAVVVLALAATGIAYFMIR